VNNLNSTVFTYTATIRIGTTHIYCIFYFSN